MMKVLGKEYGMMPTVVVAAAMVPNSSTSITALCSTCDFTSRDKGHHLQSGMCEYVVTA